MKHFTLLLLGSFLYTSPMFGQRLLPHGTGISGQTIRDMEVYDGKLVIAGFFSGFNGYQRRNIQGWDGTQNFDMPGAFETNIWSVYALEPYQNDLVAAGQWGVVMRWNGSTWSMIGDSLPGRITALTTYNDQLVASGIFTSPMVWNGTMWTRIGEPFNGNVVTVAVHNGELYAGGSFTATEDEITSIAYVARWNGTVWEQVLTGMNGNVNSLLSTPNGLVVAGAFTADGSDSQQLPHWTVFDGAAFSTPVNDPGTVDGGVFGGTSSAFLPGGGFFVSGNRKTLLVVDGEVEELPGFQTRAAVEYNGHTYLGGSGSNPASLVLNGFGVLETGIDREYLDVGNISALITPWATTFREFSPGSAAFEAPKGGGVASIYSAAPWITGLNQGGLYGFIPEYESDTNRAGPWADDMGEDHLKRYFQVWKLDLRTIQYHAEHWDEPGYTMPLAISSWPGNGDVANGEPAQLAPFADQNNDGIYSPEEGEYPLIRGDQAIYHIQHSCPNQLPVPEMQVDLHVMQYAYDSIQNPTLHNTVFTNYKWVNRGTRTYTDTRIALFADFDIGCPNDDLIGCDSLRSVFYAYNGDDMDESCFDLPSYGAAIPAQGVVFLNEPLVSHRDYPTEGPFLTVEDLMYGNFMGQPYDQLGYPTHFQYPGGAWVDQINGYGRRSVGATGPFTFAPGDTLCLDLAHVFAQRTLLTDPPATTMLLDRVDLLREWYTNHPWVCRETPDFITSVPEQRIATLGLYPNPTDGRLNVVVGSSTVKRSMVILDATGKQVQTANLPERSGTFNLDVSCLAPGLYFVQITGGERRLTSRFVKTFQ